MYSEERCYSGTPPTFAGSSLLSNAHAESFRPFIPRFSPGRKTSRLFFAARVVCENVILSYPRRIRPRASSDTVRNLPFFCFAENSYSATPLLGLPYAQLVVGLSKGF